MEYLVQAFEKQKPVLVFSTLRESLEAEEKERIFLFGQNQSGDDFNRTGTLFLSRSGLSPKGSRVIIAVITDWIYRISAMLRRGFIWGLEEVPNPIDDAHADFSLLVNRL